MNTDVTLSVVEAGRRAQDALDAARAVFTRIEQACSRFDPASALSRANTAPAHWHPVPLECLEAVAEASRAHHESAGLFDPRVFSTLVALGYDRSLPFTSGDVEVADPAARFEPLRLSPVPAAAEAAAVAARYRAGGGGPWRPELDRQAGAVRLGEHPIDLGGIGKGLAVRWAGLELSVVGTAQLVEAGGDCYLGGHGPDGEGWRVGVEDPAGGQDPVAVLRLSDTGCATSSVRLRTWRVGGRRVHHLIDPRTGDSARSGLRSVTVVHPDPAWAEVWSKALLIDGADTVAHRAQAGELAALWVHDDGRIGLSEQIRPLVMWQAQR